MIMHLTIDEVISARIDITLTPLCHVYIPY